jgi:hypothetical protein
VFHGIPRKYLSLALSGHDSKAALQAVDTGYAQTAQGMWRNRMLQKSLTKGWSAVTLDF